MPRYNTFVRAGALAIVVLASPPLQAQSQSPSPGPGPTNPVPNPAATPGNEKTIVINPTIEECRRGWVSGSQWSKEQFDKFCEGFKQSK